VIGPPFSQRRWHGWGPRLGGSGTWPLPPPLVPPPLVPPPSLRSGFCGMLAPVRPLRPRPWALCALGSGSRRASRPFGPGPWLRSSPGPSLGLSARGSPVARAGIPPGLGALRGAGPCPLRPVALAGPYCWPARGPSSLCGGRRAAVGPALAGVGFCLGARSPFARRAPGPPLPAFRLRPLALPSLLPPRGRTGPRWGPRGCNASPGCGVWSCAACGPRWGFILNCMISRFCGKTGENVDEMIQNARKSLQKPGENGVSTFAKVERMFYNAGEVMCS